jgi:ribonucleoside-diphosphate reductase alpha chain
VKSLYYCRSLSIQRADTISEKALAVELVPTARATQAGGSTDYEECLACQ